tara:strand:+ start:260 stop:790 length:531 start_codon:yes stop_codon:yes gene_type:complete
MTVYANKPAFNVREKLKEIDYGKIPYHKMPVGSVIQVTHKRVASAWISTTSTTLVASGVKLSIFPKRENSLILIRYNLPMTHTHSSVGATMVPELRRVIGGSTGVVTNINPAGTTYPQGYIDPTGNYQSIVIADQDFPNTQLEVEYEVYFRSTSGGNTHLAHNGSSYYLQLMEIAQ